MARTKKATKGQNSEKAERTKEALTALKQGKSKEKKGEIAIDPLNERVLRALIKGDDADYVQHAFASKSQIELLYKMAAQTNEQTRKTARKYGEEYRGSLHVSTEGWYGIPCTNIKNAMVAACRNTGNTMSETKQTFRVLEDGRDRADGTPLVRILGGTPVPVVHAVRNSGGGSTDLRVRAKWHVWYAMVRIRYDANTISEKSLGNLLVRAGRYAGIGEGRASSKKSVGMDWGYFTTIDPDTEIPGEGDIQYPQPTEMERAVHELIAKEEEEVAKVA